MTTVFDQKIQDIVLNYIPDEDLLTLFANNPPYSPVDAPPEYGGLSESEEEDSSDEEPGTADFLINIDE